MYLDGALQAGFFRHRHRGKRNMSFKEIDCLQVLSQPENDSQPETVTSDSPLWVRMTSSSSGQQKPLPGSPDGTNTYSEVA